jgi:hypothetical protein
MTEPTAEQEGQKMPTLKTKQGEISVSQNLVARMERRLWQLRQPERRTAYIERARRRLNAGRVYLNDTVTVLAAGG